MPVPIATTRAPYAIPAGETNLDTTPAGIVTSEVQIVLKLTGTVAQLQADWATLLATSLTAPSAIMHVDQLLGGPG